MLNKLNSGRNLKFIRKNTLNLSRPKLAKRLGVATKTIYNWEQKKELDYIKWQAVLNLIPIPPVEESFSIGYKPNYPQNIIVDAEIAWQINKSGNNYLVLILGKKNPLNHWTTAVKILRLRGQQIICITTINKCQ